MLDKNEIKLDICFMIDSPNHIDVLLTKEDKIEILTKIESSKSDMVRWFFAFFVTIVLMVVGLYFRK